MLQKSIEEQTPAAGVTTIESEGEFVEIGVQMRSCDRSLMGAKQPTFEQRSDAMDSRHGNVCWISGAGKYDWLVPVSMFRKVVVPSPPIAAHHRAWLDCVAYKRDKAVA